MKIEFVEYYPFTLEERAKMKNKNYLGTVHIYLCEEELDVRGILAIRGKGKGKSVFFSFPHFYAKDPETGERCHYPMLRFTNDEKHKKLMDYMHAEVKPIVRKHMEAIGDDKRGVDDKRPTPTEKIA